MTRLELQTVLRGQSLEDILLTGFIDSDESPARFRPILGFVYFEFGAGLFEFAEIGTTGSMTITLVANVRHQFELDDNMVPAAMSMRELVLRDPDGRNEIGALHLWSAEEIGGELRCSAARLDILNGQVIFVDPSYHFGLRLGGSEQESIWRASWPMADKAQHDVLVLDRGVSVE